MVLCYSWGDRGDPWTFLACHPHGGRGGGWATEFSTVPGIARGDLLNLELQVRAHQFYQSKNAPYAQYLKDDLEKEKKPKKKDGASAKAKSLPQTVTDQMQLDNHAAMSKKETRAEKRHAKKVAKAAEKAAAEQAASAKAAQNATTEVPTAAAAATVEPAPAALAAPAPQTKKTFKEAPLPPSVAQPAGPAPPNVMNSLPASVQCQRPPTSQLPGETAVPSSQDSGASTPTSQVSSLQSCAETLARLKRIEDEVTWRMEKLSKPPTKPSPCLRAAWPRPHKAPPEPYRKPTPPTANAWTRKGAYPSTPSTRS